jgi:hypothetical protein
VRQLTILRDGYLYSIDPFLNRGTRMPDIISRHLMKHVDQDETATIGAAVMAALGGREAGSGSVLGYPCSRWEVDALDSVSCIHQGIPLSAEAEIGGVTVTYTAVSAAFDTPVPAEIFMVPAGVDIQDAPAPQNLPAFD